MKPIYKHFAANAWFYTAKTIDIQVLSQVCWCFVRPQFWAIQSTQAED